MIGLPKQTNPEKAFTLVELLVVCGIFSTIVIVIVSIFVSLIQLQKNILLTKKALGEANYALEFMSRALRMAEKELTEGGECIPLGENYQPIYGNQGVRFKNGNEGGECQEFYLENGQIKFKRPNKPPFALTSPAIEISQLQFFLQGESQTDQIQPLVTITFTVELGQFQPLKFQTSISQRNLDVVY